MKKILLISFLSIAVIGVSHSQDEVSSDQTQKREMSPPPKEQKDKDPNAPSFKDRLFFGGFVGFNFFGNYTYIDISPMLGYRISPKLLGGVGLTYRYVKYEQNGFSQEDNQYGYRLFGRYFIIPQLFAHAEFESLNLTAYTFDPQSSVFSENRKWVNSAFLGGGVYQSAGKSAGVFIMALYNVLGCDEGNNCPYPDGWLLRVGVTAGF